MEGAEFTVLLCFHLGLPATVSSERRNILSNVVDNILLIFVIFGLTVILFLVLSI